MLFCISRTLPGRDLNFLSSRNVVTLNAWENTVKPTETITEQHADEVAVNEHVLTGKTLASMRWDNTIKLWDVKTGKERANLKGHTDRVDTVAFTPDGKTLASWCNKTGSQEKTIRLWDVATGKEHAILTGHTDFVNRVAYSPDGKTLASVSADKTIKLWDVPAAKKADK